MVFTELPPCFYSSPEWLIQTLPLQRVLLGLSGYHRFYYMLRKGGRDQWYSVILVNILGIGTR